MQMNTQEQSKVIYEPSGIVFTKEMNALLKQEARRRTISKSALVREAVRDYFEKSDVKPAE